MLRRPKILFKTLSVRISLMVVSAMAVLLIASMTVMLYYSRKALKQGALEKATQTLEGTVQNIDNILLSVEQATGNIFVHIYSDLDKPDMMFTYSQRLLESNPYIQGCAIAFKEDFYKDRHYFMAYVYRQSSDSLNFVDAPIIQSEVFGNCPYTEQVWFTQPMETGRAQWLNPMIGIKADVEPIVTFSLPVYGRDRKPVAVIGVDVSLRLLSAIVEKAKPSPNSYSTLLDKDGSYIVHPDSRNLSGYSVFDLHPSETDSSARAVARAMTTSEQTDYKPFRLNGTDYFVFFKPFKKISVRGRSNEDLGWTVGIVYPEDDIFGDYNSLLYYVLAITLIGLLLLFVLSRTVIHLQLKPLLLLSKYAQRIAQGNYYEPIPGSSQKDEIGRLQENFQKMQHSLAEHIGELEQLTATRRERGEELRQAYKHSQKADRMKTAFLHNMTNQMLAPAEIINNDVTALKNLNGPNAKQETLRLVGDIQQNGHTIVELLKHLLNMSDEELEGKDGLLGEEGKEEDHD